MADYPVIPQTGLALRDFRFAGHLRVDVLRVRARLLSDDTGAVPIYEDIDIPMPASRAIVAAYAHPFVADAVTTDAVVGDSNVVRPICAVRGKRRISLAIPDNDTADWPGAMGGTLETAPIGAEAHYQREDVHELAPNSVINHPARIANVKDKGVDPDNALNNIYSLLLNSGVSVSVSLVTGGQPSADDTWPLTIEANRVSYTVGSIGRGQERLYPPRNMYHVPTQGDDPDARFGPLTEQDSPDTVIHIRGPVADLPLNPNDQVLKVTLNSGATVKVPYDGNSPLVIGKPLTNPSAIVDQEPEAIDPNEYAEFDVLIVTANDNDPDNDAALAGLSHADPWAIFPNCIAAGETP